MDTKINHIVVVGGGSAGWLTAGLLAAEHGQQLKISLIESPHINTLGVGEGTWPSMRNTLQRIGIEELDFIHTCDASFKQGSKFIGWCNGQSSDSYYHPFMSPVGYGNIDLHSVWQAQAPLKPFASVINNQSEVCQAGLAPKQIKTPPYASVTNYGYHLDATKFAQLLTTHCTTKLGVNHIQDHIISINNDSDDYIQSIETESGQTIKGDLFIDCSGLTGLLIGQHYGIKNLSQKHILFNDSALAVQVQYENDDSPIESATLSTAVDNGWIWDIGLPSRRGTGHVYSSQYQTDEQAKETLTKYLSETIGTEKTQALSFRKISFEPAYRKKFWHKNVVAVGMSAGFIEPLEASALALVELSISMISEQMPKNREQMAIIEKRFNQRFEYRWQRIIEFLKLHYVISKRKGKYWDDHKASDSIPSRLQELLTLWKYQTPSRYDLPEQEEIFPSVSYQYVLYGMGFKTSPAQLSQEKQKIGAQLILQNTQKTKQCLDGLPSNRTLIRSLITQSPKEL